MDKDLLLKQIDELRAHLLAEGVLDKYFVAVESLQKLKSDYVEHIVGTYFSSSGTYMDGLQHYLNTVPLDVKNVGCLIHKLKGSCGSLGAAKVHAVVGDMLDIFKAKAFHRLNAALQRIRVENANLKMYLEPYVELLRQLRFIDQPPVEASNNQEVEASNNQEVEASNNLEEVESVDSNDFDGSN